MRHRAALVLVFVLVAAACGDDASTVTSGTPSTGGSSSTSAAGRNLDPITVELGDTTFTVPGESCLAQGEDVAVVIEAARESAVEVEQLVASRVSGWPTTTVALDGDFDATVRPPAVRALALANLTGSADDLLVRWSAFEQVYADPDQGFPPVSEISERIEQWRTESVILVLGIAQQCALRAGG